jgi:hypothetical protein
LRQSPWAILDTFVGSRDDGIGPAWMQWNTSLIVFYHRVEIFIEVFKRMATSNSNLEQVSSSATNTRIIIDYSIIDLCYSPVSHCTCSHGQDM